MTSRRSRAETAQEPEPAEEAPEEAETAQEPEPAEEAPECACRFTTVMEMTEKEKTMYASKEQCSNPACRKVLTIPFPDS